MKNQQDVIDEYVGEFKRQCQAQGYDQDETEDLMSHAVSFIETAIKEGCKVGFEAGKTNSSEIHNSIRLEDKNSEYAFSEGLKREQQFFQDKQEDKGQTNKEYN